MMCPRAVSVLFACIVAAACVTLPLAAQDESFKEAHAALRRGDYDEAISRFSRLVGRNPGSADAARGLVQALSEVGRYDQAVAAARAFGALNPGSGELKNALGEVLVLRGRLAEAENAFNAAVARSASDSITAELNLALLLERRGNRDSAMRLFDSFVDAYNANPNRSARELTAIATAVRHLGASDWRLYQDALRAYDEAIAADPEDPAPRVLVGELFLEKYNGTDARSSFQDVLGVNPRHPRALLGLARTLRFEGSPEAMKVTRQSLGSNPKLVPARVFLATLQLELEDYRAAQREIERALEIDPTAPEALAVLAALKFLEGDKQGFSETVARATATTAAVVHLYNTLSEASARNRLYHDAVRFAREAVQADSTSWRGYALLGMNQLRLGRMAEGRTNLEKAFAGNPYDVWTKNTLDLLDELDTYVEAASPRFRFYVEAGESPLLSLYLATVAERAYEQLSARYGYSAPTPIRVELFADHADFSVRTLGLVGVGALGVSFGPVVAMDSPSAREMGPFNWASTLWHEIAHSFHLGMTGHRVPRWFTEGLAVYEERRAHRGWGQNVTPGFLAAYKAERLLPVSELNNGFLRPEYPEQLSFSYYQASLVCELIERDFGPGALRRMLEAYRDGLGTPSVFRLVLGVALPEFDRRFDAYLRRKFGGPLAALRSPMGGEHERLSREEIARRAERDTSDFAAQLTLGRVLLGEGRLEEAARYLERARALFPGFAAAGSPYWHLADAYRRTGDIRKAAAALEAMTGINGDDYRAFTALAELSDSLGDGAAAARALEGALYAYPFDAAVHRRLAELATEQGDLQLAVRERRAIVALDPVDRAQALYDLALVQFRAGSVGDAKRSVLHALEIAPNFAAAQELLLEIYGKH